MNEGEAEWITTDFFDTDENNKIIEHWHIFQPILAEEEWKNNNG